MTSPRKKKIKKIYENPNNRRNKKWVPGKVRAAVVMLQRVLASIGLI